MDLNTVEQWTAEAVSEYFESLGTPFKDYAKAFLGKSWSQPYIKNKLA